MKYALLIYSPSTAEEYAAAAVPRADEAAGEWATYDAAMSRRQPVRHNGQFASAWDLDAALDWAARMPAAGVGTVEVRAAVSGMAWQKELD